MEIDELLAETLPIFRKIDRLRARSDDRNSRLIEPHCKIERSLATELNDHTFWFLYVDNVHDVFKRQWLEIEAV